MITGKTKVYCIIGNPVVHSLSPQMYNAAFDSLGLDMAFVAFPVTNLKMAIAGLKALNVGGIVVTIPHKQEILNFVDLQDETVKAIGAANAIKVDNNILTATNTDWSGAITALEEKTSLENKKVAILGAGGAARAIIYGLKKRNAKVSLYNRSVEKAIVLAKEFSLEGSGELNAIERIRASDIIINTTSVGMVPNVNESPIPQEAIHKNQIVFDIVYTPSQTKLLQYAKEKEAACVFGYKMILFGGIKIFEFFTGQKAPTDIMEKTLLKHLNIKN